METGNGLGGGRGRLRGGFTLIELLVVVAILAILASLAASGWASAKAKARLIQCVNHHRQLATVWTMYAQDNHDLVALNGIPAGEGKPLWVQGVVAFSATDSIATNLITDPNYALFAEYITSVGVYRCPLDRSTITVGSRTYPIIRSYALNAYLGYTVPWNTSLSGPGEYKVYRHYTDIDLPSRRFSFIEVCPKSICWPFFGVVMTAPGAERAFHWPAAYHRGRGTISFVDGHTEAHRWLDPRTLAPKSAAFHVHDDFAPNNSDLAWLQAGATSKN